MERRKKGSGRITYVEDRKSPWLEIAGISILML